MDEVTGAERGLAVFVLIMAIGMAYIAVDTLCGNKFTKGFMRSASLASVTQLPVPEEPPAS